MTEENEKHGSSEKRGVFKLPKAGYPYFGQAIGILMFDTKTAVTNDLNVPAKLQEFTRIPGDVGNATSFNFPVQYKLMRGLQVNDIVCTQPTTETEHKIAELAKEMEREGVRAIATTCGIMSWFQPVMAEAVDIPVFASSLLQVPVVSRVMGKNKKVGIITVDAEFLTQENLSRVGIDESIPHIVYGLERSGLFVSEIEPAERLKALEGVLVPTATKMVKDNPEVAAIVYECTLLPPTSAAVQEATGLPVFDVITLIKWAYSAVVQKKFDGFM
jgi:Asp/Glu/hydantoin racemase